MNGPPLFHLQRPFFIDGLTDDVKEPAQSPRPHRYFDRRSRIYYLHARVEPVSGSEGHTASYIVTKVLHDLHGQVNLVLFDHDGVVQIGQVFFKKFNINNRPYDLHNLSFIHEYNLPPLTAGL